MENLNTFIDKLKKFFGLVEAHVRQIEDYIKETKKPCDSIINQSQFLRAVLQEKSKSTTALDKLPGFRNCLIGKILNSLEEEFGVLEEIRDKISFANDVLNKEQKSLENLYNCLRTNNLINCSEINPCCPSFEHIITWCSDIWRCYHLYYLQVAQALVNLQFDNEASVRALSQSVKEDLELKKFIDIIRSFDLSNFEFFLKQ